MDYEEKIDKRISALVSTINILNNKFVEYTSSTNKELLMQREKIKLLEETRLIEKNEHSEMINKLNSEMLKLSESYKSIISEQEKFTKYQALENLSMAQSIHDLTATIQSQNEATAKNSILIQNLLESQNKISSQNETNTQNISTLQSNVANLNSNPSTLPTPTSVNLSNQFFGTGALSRNASFASPIKGQSLINKLARNVFLFI